MKTFCLYILSILIGLFLLVPSVKGRPSGTKNSSVSGLQVTALGTPGTCLNNASITASVQGNGNDIVNYQLLQGGTVIRYYQASNIFNNLPAGQNYRVQVIDITNSETAYSLPLSLTTTYQNLTLSANNTQVETCAGASNGVLSVTVNGGRGPYLFSLAGAKTIPPQNSNIFSGLTQGTYSITVVDNCGSSQVIEAQVALEPNPISSLSLCGGSAYIGYQIPNNCNSPLMVGLMNTLNNASGSPLTSFEQSLYTWAYEYPSGSGNIYGSGGVLGAPPVPVSILTIPLISSASYPYTYGDIIIYDGCGNSKIFKQLLYPSVPESGPGILGAFEATVGATFDCNQGAGVTMNVPGTQAICYPIQYTFTDLVDGSQLKFTKSNYTSPSFSFYGFTPGHSYHVVSVDGNGHRANWFNTDNITMPLSAGGFGMAPVQSWNNNLGYNEANPVAVAPSAQKIGTPVYYTVTASNNPQVPLGYSDSSKYTTMSTSIALNGPNANKTWPAGTYTLQLKGSCYSSTHTFTIYGYTGKLNGVYTESPACGSFSLGVEAFLPNINNNPVSSSYYITILSGPSNVGKTATFNAQALTKDVYSALFPGLAYGTYTLGLGVLGGPNNAFGQETISYMGANTLSIDAATTLGWICPGDSTGTLTVNAQSSSGSALYYSINNGPYQSSNIFQGLNRGTYGVKVIDACGNVASYMASVIKATPLQILSSSLNPCLGTSLSLTAQVAGALSFSWSGPNGFKSTVQSPNIPITGVECSGVYSVQVITPTCTLTGYITISVPAPPVLNLNPPKPVFYPNTVDITTSAILSGNSQSLVLSYYKDSLATQILQNPNAIRDSGTYYIKATQAQGCSVIRPVQVIIYTIPVAQIQYPNGPFCPMGSIQVVQTGTPGGTYSSSKGLEINSKTGEINLSASMPGDYIITYSFSNGLYTKTTQTQLVIQALPSPSQAGNDQYLCNTNTAYLSANTPLQGKGIWTLLSSTPCTLVNPYSPQTQVNGLKPGTYIFEWTIQNGNCASSSSKVSLMISNSPDQANAGPNQNLCKTSQAILSANQPLNGTGNWEFIQGPSTPYIVNPGNPQTQVNGLISGMYTFQWTVSLGNCIQTHSTVNIQVYGPVSVSNAGANQTLKSSIQTKTQLAASPAEIGTGLWTQIVGPNKALILNPQKDTTLLSNLISGDYTFKWTLTNGSCDSSSSLVHIQVPFPVKLEILSTHPVLCHGGNNGSCLVKASGGSGNYQYSLDSGRTFQLSNLITQLKSGDYRIRVWDIMDSTESIQAIHISEPEALVIKTRPIHIFAPFTADITQCILKESSSSDLHFSYYSDSLASQALSNPQSISQSGIYFIKGENDQGCSVISSVNLLISPVAHPDTLSTLSNHSAIINPLRNDFGKLNPASIHTSSPKHGSISLNIRGLLTYTPDSNFYGLDSLEYSVCDSTQPIAQCVQSKILIEVIGKNPKLTDLSLELSAPENVNTDTYTYSIRIQNLGPDTASLVHITDTLPLGMVFHSSNFPNYTYDPSSNIVYWNISSLPTGGKDTLLFSVTTQKMGEVINKASIQGHELDNNLKNNYAEDSTFHSGESLFFPTLFTPNGDGFNDQFIIKGLNDYPDNEIEVFNRFGNPVYRASGYMQDGKIWGGDNLADGTYFYVLSIRINGQTKKFSGYTTLVR